MANFAAGAAPTIKRVTLELGGKSPNVVFADADLEAAAASAPTAVFGNAGQDCCARSRILVQRAALERFVEFRVGDALASLAALTGPFDFVLLDLWKDLYVPVFEQLYPKLAPGAIIVADNMLQPESARAHADAYRNRVRAAAAMSSVLLAVGNGLEVSRYR